MIPGVPEFDRKKLLLRESTMAFASQLNAAKLKLEEGLDVCNSECEAIRKDLLSLLIESFKYQQLEEATYDVSALQQKKLIASLMMNSPH